MSLYIGSNQVTGAYVGSDGVLSVFLGDVLVWESGGPTPMPDFALKFTSPTSGSTFWIQPVNSPSVTPTYEYTTDGATWTSYTLGQTVSIPVGGAVYLRATGYNPSTFASPRGYYMLDTSGDVKVEGKLIGLVDKDGVLQPSSEGYFANFFQGTGTDYLSLDIDFSGITTVGTRGLSGMFYNKSYSSVDLCGLGDISSVGD